MNQAKRVSWTPTKIQLALIHIFPLCLLSLTQAQAADIVNIANPNASGLSHNQVANFDVQASGKVLNNATSTVNTQLAGQLAANPLLSNAASTILFDVSNPSRSQLNGALELAGKKAGFVLANAYGIACNGCSFINFKRVDLVAGKAVVNADSNLSYRNIVGSVEINGAGLSAEGSDVGVLANQFKLQAPMKANHIDATVVSDDAQRPALLDLAATGSMYASSITLHAPQSNSQIQLAGQIETQQNLQITSKGNIAINETILAEQGSIRVSGDQISLGKTKLVAGQDISMEGRNLDYASTALRARGDILLQASENIRSTASEGNGFTYKQKAAEQKITESVIDIFKLNISEKFSIDNKTGTVKTSESGIKVGTTAAEALSILQKAPGLSGTEIGKAYTRTVVDRTASEATQNIDAAAFEAGGNIRRVAGLGIYDQAVNITAAGQIEQIAKTIASTGFTRRKSSDSQTDTEKTTLAGGLFFKGLLPGAYLQWDKSITEAPVHTEQWGQKGSSYISGSDFISSSQDDSRYAGSVIASVGQTQIKARNLLMDGLDLSENQHGLTQGLDMRLRGEIGFFGLGASGRIGVRFGGSDGVYRGQSVAKITSGGDYSAITSADQRYVGTELAAGGSAKLISGGQLQLDNASSRLDELGRLINIGLSGGAGISWDGLEFKLGGDLSANQTTRQRYTEAAGKLTAGGDVTLSSEGDLRLGGGKVESKEGNVSLLSKGKLDIAASVDQSTTQIINGGAQAGVSFGVGWTGTPTVGFEIGGDFGLSQDEATNRTVASIAAKKQLVLQSAGDAQLEGSNLTAGSQLLLDIGGKLDYAAAENSARFGAGTVAGKFGVKIGSNLGLNVAMSGSVAHKRNNTEQRGVVRAQNLTVKVAEQAHFVGTDMRAKEVANLDVGGALLMESAQRQHFEGGAKAGVGFGLSIGLGALAKTTPSINLNLGANARSMQTNFNSVLQGEQVNLTVAKDVRLEGAVVQANQGVNRQLGGKLSVAERRDWAVGAGFDLAFGHTFLSKPGSALSLQPSLNFQQTGAGADQWTRVGGGIKLDLPTGTNLGFSGYLETAPVTQKPSGIFDRIVIAEK